MQEFGGNEDDVPMDQSLNREHYLFDPSGAPENVNQSHHKKSVYPQWNVPSSSGDSIYNKNTQETLDWEVNQDHHSEMSEEDQVPLANNNTEVAVVVNFHLAENWSYAGNFIFND